MINDTLLTTKKIIKGHEKLNQAFLTAENSKSAQLHVRKFTIDLLPEHSIRLGSFGSFYCTNMQTLYYSCRFFFFFASDRPISAHDDLKIIIIQIHSFIDFIRHQFISFIIRVCPITRIILWIQSS